MSKHIKKFNDIKQTNEDMKFVNKKDMDNWSVTHNQVKKIGKKSFNMELAKNVHDYLLSQNIDIEVGRGHFLTDKNGKEYMTFLEEKDLYEYRVKLLFRQDIDDFEYDYKEENDIDDNKVLKGEEREKMLVAYENSPFIDIDEGMEFSVFLPSQVGTAEVDLKLYAISDAMEYFHIYYNSFYYNDNMDSLSHVDDSIVNNVEGYKKYINQRGFKISNQNIEIVPEISYRIYKDSKFFANFLGEYKGADRILEHLITLL